MKMVIPSELNSSDENNNIACRTAQSGAFDNVNEYSSVTNRLGSTTQKQDAASVEAEHGVFKDNLYPNTTTERLEAASTLAHAIAECDPRDAVVIMSAALSDLSTGGPLPVFENAQSDADFWADLAAPFEIEAYFNATIERLNNLEHGINSRKRIFLKLWETFSETDRMAFIEKVDPHGKFVRRIN